MIAFLSLQLRSTKIIRLLHPGGKVCVTGVKVCVTILPTTGGGSKERAWERGCFDAKNVYKESLCWILSSINRWKIIFKILAMLCIFFIYLLTITLLTEKKNDTVHYLHYLRPNTKIFSRNGRKRKKKQKERLLTKD